MLLRRAGVTFDILVPEVEEVVVHNDIAAGVTENANRKHAWAASRRPDHHILAADTAIEFEQKHIGKPSSENQAKEFLRMFSGKTHVVYTAVAFSLPNGPATLEIARSQVTFKELEDDTIEDYIRLVKPMDRAGAYDIDEYGELVVASYTGSLTNIIGLPMEIVRPLLRKADLLS